METRVVEQVKLYLLCLNPVMGSAEDRSVALVCPEKEEILRRYNEELLPCTERYRDSTGIFRSFREGILFRYNPSYNLSEDLREEWVDKNELEDIKSRFTFLETQTI